MPMIPPDSSWISPKRISVSTFSEGRTSKPLVLPLGPSKQQPLPLDRVSLTPFTCQDGVSDKVPSPLESTHVRVDNDKETENLTASTAQSLFKEEIHLPSPATTSVEGTLVIAVASGRAVELYGCKKKADEEGEKSLTLRMYLCRWNEGIMGYQRG